MEPDELQAVRNTLAAYNLTGDRMLLKALAATFMEDGVLETPIATFRGRDSIVRGLGARVSGEREHRGPAPRRPTFVRHHLTTSLLESRGTRAAGGRSYFIVFTDIGPDHAGIYVDKLRKVGSEWLFEHRRVMIDWMSDATFFSSQHDAYVARRAVLIARNAGAGATANQRLDTSQT